MIFAPPLSWRRSEGRVQRRGEWGVGTGDPNGGDRSTANEHLAANSRGDNLRTEATRKLRYPLARGGDLGRGLGDAPPKKIEVRGRPMHWSPQYLEK